MQIIVLQYHGEKKISYSSVAKSNTFNPFKIEFKNPRLALKYAYPFDGNFSTVRLTYFYRVFGSLVRMIR